MESTLKIVIFLQNLNRAAKLQFAMRKPSSATKKICVFCAFCVRYKKMVVRLKNLKKNKIPQKIANR